MTAKKSAAKPKGEKKSEKAPSKKKAAPVEAKRAAAPKLGSAQCKCPGEEEVVTLVRRLKSISKAASEKAGEVGEMIAKAVETKHFDRKALSIVRGLEQMSDNKLQVTLPHLMMYIDALQLNERAERQGQLIADQHAKAVNGKGGKRDGGDAQMDTEDAPGMQAMPQGDDAEERPPIH